MTLKRRDRNQFGSISVQEQYMMETLREDSEMDLELCVGKMGQLMKGNGKTIMHSDKESLFMQVETYMRVNGQRIEQMAMVSIIAVMEEYIKVNGSMTNNKVVERNFGLMGLALREIIMTDLRLVSVFINGLMVLLTKVNGITI